MWMVAASPVRWYIQRAASMCTSLRDRGGWWCCLCVFLSVFASWCVLLYKLLASQLEGNCDWKKNRGSAPELMAYTYHGLYHDIGRFVLISVASQH